MTVISNKDANEPDYRFEYLELLSDAIQTYIASVEHNEPKIFIHQNSNLKFAFERALYFIFADDLELYDFFVKCKKGESINRFRFSSRLHYEVSTCLANPECHCQELAIQGEPILDVARRYLGDIRRSLLQSKILRYVCTDLVQLLRFNSVNPPIYKNFKNNESWKQSKSFKFKNCSDRPQILFLIDHSRYLDFLQPILNHVPCPYAYIVIEDTELEKILIHQNKPLISCRLNISFNRLTHHNTLFKLRGLLCLYDCLYQGLSQLVPKSLVVVEGNFAEDEILNQACKRLSLPVYCIQQGWSPIIHSGFRNMSFSKMFVWGQSFADLLKSYNPDQDFVPIGSFTINSDISLTPFEKRSAISFFLQVPYKLISEKAWFEFIELIEWTSKNFQEVPVLVREHPRFKIPQEVIKKLLVYPNVKLMPPEIYPLNEILSQSLISISIYSSTIIESLAAGSVPVIVNLTSMPRYNPDLHSLGAAIEVKSVDEAKTKINSLITDRSCLLLYQKALQKIRTKFVINTGEHAAMNLAEKILNCELSKI